MGCAEVISFEEMCARKQWSTLRQHMSECFDRWLLGSGGTESANKCICMVTTIILSK